MSNHTRIQHYILSNVAHHPADIVARVCKKFNVSRMTATRHLNALAQQKKILKTGVTSNTQYYLFTARQKNITTSITHELDEFQFYEKNIAPSLNDLPDNQKKIFEYACTELINNAKDHSTGKKLTIQLSFDTQATLIQIIDDGIGIFKKLQKAFQLSDLQESLLTVTKGRITTDKNNHTGEGIFFSSRAVDRFILESNGIGYIKDNKLDEWFYRPSEIKRGTKITLIIYFDCSRQLTHVFQNYTEPEDYQFDKTEVLVELAKLGDERYISRSQAKRVLSHLEKFSIIILDFRNIETVGQGFVDEVFRVYQHQHSHVKIEYRNANEAVQFMIHRGLPTQ